MYGTKEILKIFSIMRFLCHFLVLYFFSFKRLLSSFFFVSQYDKMVTMIRISLKKCRELYLIEEYFQSVQQHYLSGVHL